MLKKVYRFRLIILIGVILAVYAAIWGKLFIAQILRHDYYAGLGRAQHTTGVSLQARRGDILDRNLMALATSGLRDTIILDPAALRKSQPPFKPSPAAIGALAQALHRPQETVAGWFKKKSRTETYRKAPDEVVEAVKSIAADEKFPRAAFIYKKDSKRAYPNGRLAAHVLGFTKIDGTGDNIGQEGLELKYNDYMKGASRRERVSIDVTGRKLSPLDDKVIEGTYGASIVLTIDRNIQMFAQRALRRRLAQTESLSGVAVVMDVATGDILALTNMPDFDPNDFAAASNDERRNAALTDPIEIGSVMKIVTMTLLLDNKLVELDEMIDCEGGKWGVDGRTIKDSHPLGVVPVTKVFAESSNVGMAKLGLRLEPKVFYEGLLGMGLGSKTGIDLRGESGGIFYPLEKWTRLSRTSLPIGYECALTPMQVVDILGAIGNGGRRMKPRLLKEVRSRDGVVIMKNEPVEIGRVASKEACDTVLGLMERVVLEGTGEMAAVPGIRIGGKTGTTRKFTPEGEKRRYIASFAGLVPIDKPRIAIYVYINEPHSGIFYGGTVAAPVFQDIAMQAVHILDIPRSDPKAFDEAFNLQFRPEGELVDDAVDTATLVADASPPDAEDEVFEGEDAMADPLGAAIMAAATAGMPPSPGARRMPDYAGMPIRAAAEAVEKDGITADFQGSGVVVRQQPAAGDWLEAGKQAVLIFELPSEKNGTRAARPADAETSETGETGETGAAAPAKPKGPLKIEPLRN